MKKLSWIFVLALFLVSCEMHLQNEALFNETDPMRSGALVDPSARMAYEDTCGDIKVVPLWAGQHIEAGILEVYNSETMLYVHYQTSEGWYLTETHLYVGNNPPKNKAGILVPGKFPYSNNHNYLSSVLYEIPLTEVGDCFEVYAHAVVKMLDEYGNVMQEETAFGGDTRGNSSRWYFYTDYCVQDCEEECIPSDETAWSDGEPYTEQGNWATYTVYFNEEGWGEAKEVTLYAGQTIDVGVVRFSDPWFNPQTSVGEVTITIELNDCWDFDDVMENVKIQGYYTAPMGNPNPGGFEYKADAEGKTFTIVVAYMPYYGVHVDVTGGCCE